MYPLREGSGECIALVELDGAGPRKFRGSRKKSFLSRDQRFALTTVALRRVRHGACAAQVAAALALAAAQLAGAPASTLAAGYSDQTMPMDVSSTLEACATSNDSNSRRAPTRPQLAPMPAP